MRNSLLNGDIKFKLYSRINEEEAIKFAERNQLYSVLLEYYCEKMKMDKVTDILTEFARKEEYWILKDDFYFLRFVTDSVLKSKARSEEILRFLYGKCHSQEYYGLCVDIGIEMGDKELLKKLIDKKPDYFLFRHESKIKLLSYLKDYREAQKELKMFVESLVNQKSNYDYEKAVECALVLRDVICLKEWNQSQKNYKHVC